LVGVSVGEIVLVLSSDLEKYPADYLAPILMLLSFVSSLLLQLLCMYYGRRTSAALFYFYLLSTVCGSVILRSIVEQRKNIER